MQRERAVALERVLPVLADAGRGRRAQIELGERGAQVEAGASDDQRPPAGRQQPVDLGVGEAGVGAGAEGLGHREEADQAVLEAVAFGRRRGAGEGLEPGVDLERVGRDDDRVFVVCP